MKLLVSILSILTLFLLVTGAASADPQRTTLYDFGGGGPGPLTIAQDGSLYGTLASGGAQGRGEVYRLSPDTAGWRKEVLHQFSNDGNGIGPGGALSILNDGTVPGTTTATSPGAYEFIPDGFGTLFALTPSAGGAWTKQVLRIFNGMDPARPGESPNGGLVPDGQGSFLGTTANKIFRLIPPTAKQTKWRSVVLMSFSKKNRVQNGSVCRG